jgi:hypothetical protein
MAYRRAILRAAFIAILAAWPVGIYLVRQHDWKGEIGVLVVIWAPLASVVFFTACAVALRSWVVGGILVGLCVGAFAPDAGFAIILPIFGALVGLVMEDRAPKKTRSASPKKLLFPLSHKD